MAQRDRVAEIADIRRRGPKAVQGFSQEFDTLRQNWEAAQTTRASTDDFFLIRAVTLLEVFTRLWAAALIDDGPPYVERVAGLKIDLKCDFRTVRAIHGRVITMGELLAHNLSLSAFGQTLEIFKVLLGQSLLPLIEKAVDTRTKLSDLVKFGALAFKTERPPIVKDVSAMCAQLTRLFEIRHILCHEFPREEVYDRKKSQLP